MFSPLLNWSLILRRLHRPQRGNINAFTTPITSTFYTQKPTTKRSQRDVPANQANIVWIMARFFGGEARQLRNEKLSGAGKPEDVDIHWKPGLVTALFTKLRRYSNQHASFSGRLKVI